jgi:predicted  nucleic acid-binding Zn-ribbon protein
MSDNERNDRPRRGGSWFTFLLALAAFVMSATALYQLNRNSDAIQRFEDRMRSLYGDMRANASFDNLGDWLKERAAAVRDAVTDGDNYDTATGLLDTIGDRIGDYLDQLKGEEGSEASRLRGELEQLQDEIKTTRQSVADRSEGALDEVNDLTSQIERVSRRLNSKVTGSGSGSAE